MENILYMIDTLLLSLLSPAIIGIMHKIKARIQGIESDGVFSPYRDLMKLFRQEIIVSSDSSWIGVLAPYVVFTATLALATGIPFINITASPATGDITVFIYLLCAAAFLAALFAIDTGGKFEFQTTVTSLLSKAGLIIPLATIALMTGSANFTSMTHQLLSSQLWNSPSFILSAIAFFLILCIETDIGEKHRDAGSGAHLALIEWAVSNKVLILMVLFTDIFVPFGLATSLAVQNVLAAVILLVTKMVVLAFLLEVVRSKISVFGTSKLLTLSYVLSITALLIV